MNSDDLYSNLKKEITLCVGTEVNIEHLKENFQDEVRISRRTLHRISCLDNLLGAFEQLDLLNEQNTDCLVKLGNMLRNQKILDLVKLYNKAQDLPKPCDYCRNRIFRQGCNNQIPITAAVSYCGETTTQLPQEIDPTVHLLNKRSMGLKNAIKALSSRLHVWWPVLLRELDLKERHIASIRRKFRGYESQALKALDYWSIADEEASVEKLHRALSSHECKRHGLTPKLMEFEPYVSILL